MKGLRERLKAGNVSDAVRRLNPQLFGSGALDSRRIDQQPKHRPALGSQQARKADRPRKVGRGNAPLARILIICIKSGVPFDSDNLAAGYKGLRDAIARSLNLDDEDGTILWEYASVVSHGQAETIVRLEQL